MTSGCLGIGGGLRCQRGMLIGLLGALLALGAPAGARAEDLVLDPDVADVNLLAPPALAPAEDGSLLESDLAQYLDREFKMDFDPALYADAGPAPVGGAAAPPEGEPVAPPAKKGPPLPLYTVEGTGGGLIVPQAYLVNPGPPGTNIPGPTAGYTFVKIGEKTVQQASITETFYKRIELGYALSTLHLGEFPGVVRRATGIDIGLDHVVMHNFSVRTMLIDENDKSLPLPLPTITFGTTFKYNPHVQTIDRRLFGGVRALGMERSNGTDFTLTASKMFPKLAFGRPVIANGGLRFSQGAQLGLLGFGDAYRVTAEGSVCTMVTDWLVVAYEYRQKKNPYRRLGDIVGKEDSWHTVCLAFILSDRLAFATGWGHFGNVVNDRERGVWGFQLKYEF